MPSHGVMCTCQKISNVTSSNIKNLQCADFVCFLCIQVFVLFVTMCREAFDDFVRFLRDREVNSQVYKKLTKKGNQRINRLPL